RVFNLSSITSQSAPCFLSQRSQRSTSLVTGSPSRAGPTLREQMSGAGVAGVGPPHRFPDLAASGVTGGEAPVVLLVDGLVAQPMEPVALAHLAVATVVMVGLPVPAAAVQLVVLQAMCVALHVDAFLALVGVAGCQVVASHTKADRAIRLVLITLVSTDTRHEPSRPASRSFICTIFSCSARARACFTFWVRFWLCSVSCTLRRTSSLLSLILFASCQYLRSMLLISPRSFRCCPYPASKIASNAAVFS